MSEARHRFFRVSLEGFSILYYSPTRLLLKSQDKEDDIFYNPLRRRSLDSSQDNDTSCPLRRRLRVAAALLGGLVWAQTWPFTAQELRGQLLPAQEGDEQSYPRFYPAFQIDGMCFMIFDRIPRGSIHSFIHSLCAALLYFTYVMRFVCIFVCERTINIRCKS